jgi:hypothetical protein
MTLQHYFQSKYISLYACMLLWKNGPNFFTKESKCNTRDRCPLFEHLSDRRTWQQSIYKIRLHLECSLDACFYIQSININVQNQCILLFSLESQCLHIKHILYHHVQTWIHNITTRILFFHDDPTCWNVTREKNSEDSRNNIKKKRKKRNLKGR